MIRTAVHLTIAMAAIAAAFLMSSRNRTQAAIERSKGETGAVSLETILITLGLSIVAAAAIALILAAVKSKGAGL